MISNTDILMGRQEEYPITATLFIKLNILAEKKS